MSDAKTTNEQLHKLLYQHEMGAIDKAQYRTLRARLIDGFTATCAAATPTKIQRRDNKTANNPNAATSGVALLITILLVLAATLLLVYSFNNNDVNPPQAQTAPPVLVDEK